MDLRIFEAIPGNSLLLQANAPHFTVAAATPGFLALLSYNKQHCVSKNFINVIQQHTNFTNDQLQEVKDTLETAVTQQRDLNVHWQLPAGNFLVQLRPVTTENGQAEYLIVTATSMAPAEQETEKDKLMAQAYNLMMNAPVAICIIKGEDLVVQLANKHMLQIWRKEEEVIGKHLLEALPEIKGSVFPDLLTDVRVSGKSHFEKESHTYFLRDGKEELVYFNFVYQPFYEENSTEASGVLVVANEVTEIVMARKKAEESELRFRNLIAEADVATSIYTGPEMKIQYANEAMIRLWGKDPSVVGKTVKEALPELEGQPFLSLLQNVYRTGETYWGKEDKGTLFVDGGLKQFYFNFSYKALRNADGEIYGILNMAIDVTNEVLARQKVEESEANLQKRVEERTLELESKNRSLLHMNANLEEFAFAASHDLKEPVRKVHYFSDRLATQLGPRLTQDEMHIVGRMQHATKRMGTLIDDLLTFSQLNRETTVMEVVDLNEKVENVLDDLELEIEEKGASVYYNKLPHISGNKRQWQQLFQNIISNALKYSRQGVAPEIHIHAQEISGAELSMPLPAEQKEKPFYKIEIKDNGIGFNQRDADRIFNIFTRLHGNAEYRGTGIGLSIVQKVVENHNGYITAEGVPGQGSSFKIFIPATKK